MRIIPGSAGVLARFVKLDIELFVNLIRKASFKSGRDARAPGRACAYLVMALVVSAIVLEPLSASEGRPEDASTNAASSNDARSNDAQGNSNKPVVLVGGVEHKQSLPPLESAEKPGRQFKDSSAEKRKGKWYRIPKWLAGKLWQSEKETHYYYEDLKTGKISNTPHVIAHRGHSTIGWEEDGFGDIWHYFNVPFSQRSYGDDNTFDIQATREMDMLAVENDKVVERSLTMRSTVDNKSLKIRRVQRTEQIITFTPVSDGQIRAEFSAKVFDADGNPESIQKFWRYQNRIEPFSNVGIFEGQDWRKIFCDYLIAQGMSERLPKNQ